MKLTKVKIYGFGKWSDVEWEFNKDYQIIYGYNEAGKTTLLTFIKSILFGFASARGDEKFQQYKPKNGGNYGGELHFIDKHDIIWTLRRVDGKNGGEVTIFRGNQEMPSSLITEITKGFSKEDFENSHVLDDSSIMSVYKLNEEQLETEIMAVGAVGSKEWLTSADTLEQASEEIYKPRGRKQPLIECIDSRNKLLKRKSEFENQQIAYKSIDSDLENTQNEYKENIKRERVLSKQRDRLNSLSEKWPRYASYRDLSQVDVSLNKVISRDDWDKSLKLDQELKTLQQNTVRSTSVTLSDDDQEFLDFYHNNKDDLDYLNAQKETIRNLQFQKGNINQQLSDNDAKIDSLYASNRDLNDHMQLLTDSELSQLANNDSENKDDQNLNWPVIGVSIVALVLATFMSGPMRIGAGLVFVVGILYAWHQQKERPVVDNNSPSFIDLKGYSGLSISRIQALQNTIRQLKDLQNDQSRLEDLLNNTEINLDQWKEQINAFHLLEIPDDLATNIEQYFSKLDSINTKSALIRKSNLEHKKLQQDNFSKIDHLQESLNIILSKYEVDALDDFMQIHSEQLQKQGVINKLEQDKSILGDDIEDLKNYDNNDDLQNQLDQVIYQLNLLYKKNDELNRQVGSLKTRQNQIFDNTAYQKVTDDLAQNENDMIELYDEWLADKLASRWIHSMLDLATENRYPKMLKRATHYFNVLTDGNYVDILFNENKLVLTRRDRMKFDVHELSKATTVQLYISLRLAFVIEISDLIDLPILIDDAFVDFDRIRTNSIFELIKEVAADNQVIYVTANLNSDLPDDHIINLEEVSYGSKNHRL
ncbi:ATP-binding protein [Companilactobacillus insicii]|uniref:ATP-binding protein n=1 Tax=Companilactobacillus insicii TaxID=1732567 RepID=UPI0013DDE058|nr:AAA family ATPase [Companilactobacillus insicii]